MRFPKTFLALFFLAPLLGNSRSITHDTIAPATAPVVDERSTKLLTTEPIFLENWINDITFVYDNVRAVDLPEVTNIPLTPPGEKFTLTWHGTLSSGYKMRWGRQHHGIDLGLKVGDPVYSAWDGIVRYAQWNKSGYGFCVVVRHKNGLETLYAHLSKLLVSPNQYVSSGDMVGLGGSTGRSTGPHLHFEIRYKDFSINPDLLIDYSTRTLRVDTFQFERAKIKGTRYSGDINGDIKKTDNTLVVQNNVPKNPDPTPLPTEAKAVEIKQAEPETDSFENTPPAPPTPPPPTIAKKATEKKVKTAPAKKETAKKTPNKKPPTTYTIKKGDTYTSIAQKTGVSIATLKKLNPKQKETLLMPGKNIRIR